MKIVFTEMYSIISYWTSETVTETRQAILPEGHVGSLVRQKAKRETVAVHVKCFQSTSDLMSANVNSRTILIAVSLN